MNKQDIFDYLERKGIRHEVTEHGAVFNMEELDAVEMPHKDRLAKNLFVRDDRKENYYLITVRGERRVGLKEFKRTFGTRHLTFAGEEEMKRMLGVLPGSVSPFGLLNDRAMK
jgi:Ala-tRNA(Pro) deacylase